MPINEAYRPARFHNSATAARTVNHTGTLVMTQFLVTDH